MKTQDRILSGLFVEMSRVSCKCCMQVFNLKIPSGFAQSSFHFKFPLRLSKVIVVVKVKDLIEEIFHTIVLVRPLFPIGSPAPQASVTLNTTLLEVIGNESAACTTAIAVLIRSRSKCH